MMIKLLLLAFWILQFKCFSLMCFALGGNGIVHPTYNRKIHTVCYKWVVAVSQVAYGCLSVTALFLIGYKWGLFQPYWYVVTTIVLDSTVFPGWSLWLQHYYKELIRNASDVYESTHYFTSSE